MALDTTPTTHLPTQPPTHPGLSVQILAWQGLVSKSQGETAPLLDKHFLEPKPLLESKFSLEKTFIIVYLNLYGPYILFQVLGLNFVKLQSKSIPV